MPLFGIPVKNKAMIGLGMVIILLLIPLTLSCSQPPAPVAAFSVSFVSGELLTENPLSGTVPFTVRFNDRSTGEITSWKWNLGDGTVVEGNDAASRNPVHTYTTTSTGIVITLTVRGPGGEHRKAQYGIVTVFRCSEAASVELNQARKAVGACLAAAGTEKLDSAFPNWRGGRNEVTAGGKDAADYLGIWKTFKATYAVTENGTIDSGTDISWGCVSWDPEFEIVGGGWRGT